MKKLVVAVCLAVLSSGLPGSGIASEQKGLQFELTPYLWMMGIDGKVTAQNREAEFSQDFSDLADYVDAGGMGLVVASYNRWVLLGQYDYTDVSLDGDDLGELGAPLLSRTKIRGSFESTIGTLAGGYRFDMFRSNWIDVMVGVRDVEIDSELKLASVPGEVRARKVSATDTLIMLRPSFRLSERWRFNPTFSYAVDGDSDTHYELSPQIQYSVSDQFALRLGYRALNYKVNAGQKGTPSFRELDGDLSGFMIGLGWTFPKNQPQAAIAAPPPRPALAGQPPMNTDIDGVPAPARGISRW